MCVSIYSDKYNVQCLNSGFNKLIVNDSTHVKMMIVQKMRKNSLNYSSIITKTLIPCVLVFYNKCKMQFLTNGYNILKVDGSTLINEDM